jgi:hypothetical protein
MATRRGFLQGLIAAGAMPRVTWADMGDPAYLAAAKAGDGSHSLHGLSAAGTSLFKVPLPGRGHAAAAHPFRAEAVAFARRPGTFAVVIDCGSGDVRAHLRPPEGRQFNGHGAFSADGSMLYTSEVVAEGSAGRIGVWDTSTYARTDEWASGGVGPHDIRLMGDGALAVANGGIATDPGDRTKLNIATMRPNLSYLAPDGAIIDQIELAGLHQNSIRHLALAADGTLAFAMQWEGDPAEPVPLLGLHRRGSAPLLCTIPEEDAMAMQGFAGSVALSGGQDEVAITSPKGGAVMIFDLAGGHLATHRRADVCGAAPARTGFMLTDGAGVVWAANVAGLIPITRSDVAWDNHLVALKPAFAS